MSDKYAVKTLVLSLMVAFVPLKAVQATIYVDVMEGVQTSALQDDAFKKAAENNQGDSFVVMSIADSRGEEQSPDAYSSFGALLNNQYKTSVTVNAKKNYFIAVDAVKGKREGVRALTMEAPASPNGKVVTVGGEGSMNYFIASTNGVNETVFTSDDKTFVNEDDKKQHLLKVADEDNGKTYTVDRSKDETAYALIVNGAHSKTTEPLEKWKYKTDFNYLKINGDKAYVYGNVKNQGFMDVKTGEMVVENGLLENDHGEFHVSGKFRLNADRPMEGFSKDGNPTDGSNEKVLSAVRANMGSVMEFNGGLDVSINSKNSSLEYPTPEQFAFHAENSYIKIADGNNRIFGNIGSFGEYREVFKDSDHQDYFYDRYSYFEYSSNKGDDGPALVGDVVSSKLSPVLISLTNEKGEGAMDSRLFDETYKKAGDWKAVVESNVTGFAEDEFPSQKLGINLSLNGNTWLVHGKSSVASVEGGGRIDMHEHGVDELFVLESKGDMKIKVDLNAADRSKSTMVYVADLHNPLVFDIANVDTMGLEHVAEKPLRFATVSRQTSEGPAKISLAKELPVYDGPVGDVSFEVVGVKRLDDKQKAEETPDGALLSEEKLSKIFDNGQSDFSANAVNYYIAAKAPTKLNESGEELLSSYHSAYWGVLGLDRLDKRLGERLMSRNNNGVWARARTDHMSTGKSAGDFSSNMYQLQVGYDHRLRADHGEWLLGAGFDYRRTRAEFKHTTNVNKLEGWGAALYATLLRDDGINLDLTADYHRLTNRFDGRADADGKNHLDVWRFSAEAQKRFDLNDDFSVTPEVQLQYVVVPGNTLGLDNGVSMHQDRFDSTVGRLGVRLDKKLSSAHDASVYAKADVLHEFSGKQKVHFKHPTLGSDGLDAEIGNKGTWYDVGVGGSWNIDRDCILSADGEYRFGHGLRRSFGLNVGVRWNF